MPSLLRRFHVTHTTYAEVHTLVSNLKKKKSTPAAAEKKTRNIFSPEAKNVARPKSRDATSLAAAVAQNGYFDPNVAPVQQRNR